MTDTRENISTGTLATSVYDRLKQDILEGHLEPELKLRVGFVRERYDAGNSPVREALNRLSSDGLVEQLDQRGFYVAPVSSVELAELTTTRCMMEELALREAISKRSTSWEEDLVIAFHRLSRVPREVHDTNLRVNQEWEHNHRAFHIALIASCGSHWLLQFCRQLADQAYRYRQLAASALGTERPILDEHKAIMEATIDGDLESAASLLQAHYQKTADAIIASGVLENHHTERAVRG